MTRDSTSVYLYTKPVISYLYLMLFLPLFLSCLLGFTKLINLECHLIHFKITNCGPALQLTLVVNVKYPYSSRYCKFIYTVCIHQKVVDNYQKLTRRASLFDRV